MSQSSSERDVVEDIVSRQALGLTVEHARDERQAARVVVEYPGGQAPCSVVLVMVSSFCVVLDFLVCAVIVSLLSAVVCCIKARNG